jgi:hypothetical protein
LFIRKYSKKNSINKIINIIKDYSYKKVLIKNKNLEKLIQDNNFEFNIKYNNLIEQNKVLKHNYETMLVNHNSKYNNKKKEYLNEINDLKNKYDEKIYSIETRQCIKQDTNNFMNNIEYNILKTTYKELNDNYNKLNENINILYIKNDEYRNKNKKLINKIDIVNEKLIVKTNKLEVVYDKCNSLQEITNELQETKNNEIELETKKNKIELETNLLLNGVIVFKKNNSSKKNTYIFKINVKNNIFSWQKLDGIIKKNKVFSEDNLYSNTQLINDLSFGLSLINKEYIFDTQSTYIRNLIVKYMNKIIYNRIYSTKYNTRYIKYN